MSILDKAKWAEWEASTRAIVNALGSGWVAKQVSQDPEAYQHWHARRVADGLELSLRWPDSYARGEQAERLTIGACWPRAKDGQTRIPTRVADERRITEISIDQRKAPEAIAKEILRRLVTPFEPFWQRALIMVEQADAYANQTEATVRAILAAYPTARRSMNGATTVYMGEESHAYSLQVSGDSVRFEAFSVPAEQAIRALELLHKVDPPVEDTEDQP